MSYLIKRVLAKPRLILDELCRLYGKFMSYLRRVLCKTRLIFPRVNGPNVASVCTGLYIKFKTAKGETGRGKEDKSLFPSSIFSSHHHPIGPRASFQYPAVKFPLLALPWEAYDGGRLLCIQQIIINRTYYMYDFIYYLVRLTSSKVIIFLSLG